MHDIIGSVGRRTMEASVQAEAIVPQPLPERLYLLDVLRGLASLMVVVWHYNHFFYVAPGMLQPGFVREMQPFYSVLFLGYEYGELAVQLFFALSGFVFFFQYAEAIRTESISAGKFFILRFSRLYPLHLATLLVVALGQAISRAIDGQTIVYLCNDWLSFGLNLLLITEWLPAGSRCLSFNGPVWSVSVEIYLYMIFFLVARRLPQRWRGQTMITGLIIAVSVGVDKTIGPLQLGEPIFCFFSGGLAYLLWSRFCPSRVGRNASIALALGALVVSSLMCWRNGPDSYLLGVVAYPSAILLLAALQSVRQELGRGLRLVGDITYSTYLLHFPIQLGLILLVKSKIAVIDFMNPIVFLLFFGLVLAASIPTYYRFERPMQRLCRRWLLPQDGGKDGSKPVTQLRPQSG